MLAWPCWPTVHSLTESSPSEFFKCYQTFVSYMQQNLMDVITNEKMYREDSEKTTREQAVDTSDLITKKELSNFGIVIGGPPRIHNNVMFYGNDDGECSSLTKPDLPLSLKVSRCKLEVSLVCRQSCTVCQLVACY